MINPVSSVLFYSSPMGLRAGPQHSTAVSRTGRSRGTCPGRGRSAWGCRSELMWDCLLGSVKCLSKMSSWKSSGKKNMPDHFYLTEETKKKKETPPKKKRKKKKALWLSAASRKKVLTPFLPRLPCSAGFLSHSDPPNYCRTIPFRKHQSELWHWFVPLLYYLILCWMKPDYFSLPLPTSWLLLVQ